MSGKFGEVFYSGCVLSLSGSEVRKSCAASGIPSV